MLSFILIAAGLVYAAEWQWSLPTPARDGSYTFLWIPPNCEQVRGIVVGQRNMLEEGIFEHPAFRANLSQLGIAEMWIVPPYDVVFRYDQGAGDTIETLLDRFAEKSGYTELAEVPIIPMGHSACASFPWNFAAWKPERTLAVLSLKGDAPLTRMTGSGRPNPDWGNRNIDGIPGLMVMGEYEWLEGRILPALEFKETHPGACLAVLADIGHGHFDISDDLISFLNLFIEKAVHYRLQKGGADLKPIDPKDGWLVQRWTLNQPRTIEPAPYSDYTGDRNEAFWAFDRESALAIQRYRKNQIGRKPQLLGFVHAGNVMKQSNTHWQVRFPGDIVKEDGTFTVQATFLDQVQEGSDNLTRWTYLPFGTQLSHAAAGGPIQIDRICGPVVKTAPETFRITLDRTWAADDRRNYDIWLRAWHPGDDEHKSIVQQALMTFPKNDQGAVQTIDFPAIENVTAGIVSIPLKAKSSSGMPVRYFVKEGPAEVIGDRLYFTPIPMCAKYPVSVSVFAYQLGRSADPKVRPSPMVERTFYINSVCPQ